MIAKNFIFFIILALFLMAGNARSVTITVGDSGFDYTSIQQAIDSARSGDIIEVQNGTYSENLIVDKQLTMKGIGMPEVDANGLGSAIKLRADGITLDGFKVMNAGQETPVSGITLAGAGIYIDSNDNILLNNIAVGCYACGIDLFSTSNTVLINNSAYNCLYGIQLHHSNNNTLIGNNASYNYLSNLHIGDSCGNILRGNIFSYSEKGISLWRSIGSGSSNGSNIDNVIIENYVANNKFGIWIQDSFRNIISRNLVANNTEQGGIIKWENGSDWAETALPGVSVYSPFKQELEYSKRRGISLWNSSDNVLYGNNLLNNGESNAYDNCFNQWDDGISGNYYSENHCSDGNNDGICDRPFRIQGGSSIDMHPSAKESQFSEHTDTSSYSFIRYIGNAKGIEIIKVHFKNSFRGYDQDIATVDRISQISLADPSLVLINDSDEVIITSGKPLILGEGLELAIESVDIYGEIINVQLSSNEDVIDSTIIIPPQTTEDLYVYSTDIGSAEDIETINVHFKGVFRGSDQDIAIVDRIWQASDANSSKILRDNCDRITFTTGTPLMLEEGYILAIESTEINGNLAYVELSKNETVVDSAVILAPDWFGKGCGLYYRGEYDKAITAFNKAITIYPEYKWAWRNKGLALYFQCKYDEAISTFDKVIEIDPEYNLDWNYYGLALHYQGKYHEAIDAFNKAIQIDSDDEWAWMNKGDSLYHLAKYNESLEAFSKAIEIDRNYTAAWNGKGNTLYALGKYYLSIVAYDKAIDIDPEYKWAWMNKGDSLYNLAKYNESFKAFSKAVEIDQNYIAAWNGIGRVHAAMGEYHLSIVAYDRAIDIDPEYKWAWFNKGVAYAAQGKYNESIDAYNKAIEIDPNYEAAWNRKGNAFFALGEYDLSIAAYDKAIDIDPEYKWAWHNKGVALASQGKYIESIDAYNTAIEVDPNWAKPWNSKGEALQKIGLIEESEAAFAKARELDDMG